MGKGILLVCGILASVIRVVGDVVSSMLYPGYSFRDQTMSQLAAAGAPTQKLQIIFLTVFDILITAFGVGVWKLSDHKRPLQITAFLLIVFGLLGLVGLFLPQAAMQLEEGLAPQLPHIIFIALAVVLIILFMAFGAFTSGKIFRFFSIALILAMLLFYILSATMAPKGVNFAYPWMGALERAGYYSYLLWILVFAVIRLNILKAKSPT